MAAKKRRRRKRKTRASAAVDFASHEESEMGHDFPMRLPLRFLVLGLLASALVRGDDINIPAKAPAVPEIPLAPMTFLVGGLWKASPPPAANGAPVSNIELRVDWTNNHQSLRFESAWVRDGKTTPYTSGFYAWDGVKKQIIFIYTDGVGTLTQGAVTREGDALVHEITMTARDGKVSVARSRMTPKGPNAFTNEIFLQKDGAWSKLIGVTYERAVEAAAAAAGE